MNRSDIHALRGLTNPVANVPQTSVGSVLSFWSIVTMLSIYLSVGSNPYASLKEWAKGTVVVLWQDTMKAVKQYGWNMVSKVGKDSAKDYVDTLVQTMKESVGDFSEIPTEAAKIVNYYHYSEIALAVLIGFTSEVWCEKLRKTGNFSFVRASVYSAGIYGSFVAVRISLLTKKAVDALGSVGIEELTWNSIKEMLYSLIESYVPDFTAPEPTKPPKPDIRDYGEELP